MWVKIDDGFVEHPKIAKVGMIGAWLQLQALCYCNRNLTDGFVPDGIARSFLSRGVSRLESRPKGELTWTIGEHNGMQGLDLPDVDWPALMVDAGLWEAVTGGYLIHDYKDFQPTKADVLAARAQWKARQQKHRLSRRDSRVTHAYPVPVPVPVLSSPERSVRQRVIAPGWRRVPSHEELTSTRKRTAWETKSLPGSVARVEWENFKAYEFPRQHYDVDASWRTWCSRVRYTQDAPAAVPATHAEARTALERLRG